MRARNSSTRAGPSIFRHHPAQASRRALRSFSSSPVGSDSSGPFPRPAIGASRPPGSRSALVSSPISSTRTGMAVTSSTRARARAARWRTGRAGSVSRLAIAGRVSGWSVLRQRLDGGRPQDRRLALDGLEQGRMGLARPGTRAGQAPCRRRRARSRRRRTGR